ncbi:DUF4367 domain-containing protein [Dehalobacterium formicoaceticum]|uniref:DUF4367 domain-containing protein n=1 Tax=Dehalobacterium formicoaceticum TaxID=51515 RepID=UPI0012F82A9C|nr:DUF4367 domain-containing protein [Dehalobacterium formicoaceticum]
MNKDIRNDIEIDNFIQDNLKVAINNQRVPDEAKDRIMQEIGIECKTIRHVFVKRFTACAAAALLIFFLASILSPNIGAALNIRLFTRVETFLENTIFNISEVYRQDTTITNNKMNPPPINKETEIQKTLEDAKRKLPFKPFMPGWLPEGVTLKDVEVIGEEDIVKIILKYSDKQLMISEMGLCDNVSLGVSFDIEDTVVENTMVRGIEGTIIKLKNDMVILKWADQGVFYSIEGYLTPDEIKKIANNLQN